MNLNHLLSLLEQCDANALNFQLDDESQTVKLELHCPRNEFDSPGLEFALGSLRESADVRRELTDYAAEIAGLPASGISVELQLMPVVDYLQAAGATTLTMRREGRSLVVVRLASAVAGQAVAYFFVMNSETVGGAGESSSAERDRALYDLSVAFRKTIFEAQQKSLPLPFGFEGELVLPGSPILCLGGPRDGERVPDAGQFLRSSAPTQVYEKRWFRSAGKDRPFYIHAALNDAAAATLAQAVMTGQTK